MRTPLPLVQGAGGEAICVCDLQDLLDLKQPSVSYHLKQLLVLEAVALAA